MINRLSDDIIYFILMIILVTGGSGFIGSQLCKKLLEYDNYVICLDNTAVFHCNVIGLCYYMKFVNRYSII